MGWKGMHTLLILMHSNGTPWNSTQAISVTCSSTALTMFRYWDKQLSIAIWTCTISMYFSFIFNFFHYGIRYRLFIAKSAWLTVSLAISNLWTLTWTAAKKQVSKIKTSSSKLKCSQIIQTHGLAWNPILLPLVRNQLVLRDHIHGATA